MVDATEVAALLRSAPPEDVQATFCATLVDEWIELGVTHAVVAPGSRSTPMALALAEREEIRLHVAHDERVAAFIALGLGVASGPDGIPALLLCTSGTATANFFPAVVEAGLSEIPMVVLTADRPDELRGVGAPQTIDQIELYGDHVRWFHDPGVPEAPAAGEWRPLARRSVGESSRGPVKGPVQLNLPFREPLVGRSLGTMPGDAVSSVPTGSTLPTGSTDDVGPAFDPVPDGFDRQRGVILVGGASGVDPSAVAELHALTQWPILADAMSSMRHLDGVVTTADALLRHEAFADDHAPEVVVRVGRPASSKVLAQWTARPDLLLVQVGGPGRIDPANNVSAVCRIDELLASRPTGATGTPWSARWRRAEQTADRVISDVVELHDQLSEPAVARILCRSLADGAGLTVASSMPVRDVEWYGGNAARCHCNRGANGIDGVISTAVGRALVTGRPEYVLVGDLAFLHDSNALIALGARGVDVRIIVVDNDGGGIFSFLPQASTLTTERFESLFGTPHGTDVLALAGAHGIATSTVTTAEELTAQLPVSGPWVCRVPTERAGNVEVHRVIHDAVVAALR